MDIFELAVDLYNGKPTTNYQSGANQFDQEEKNRQGVNRAQQESVWTLGSRKVPNQPQAIFKKVSPQNLSLIHI